MIEIAKSNMENDFSNLLNLIVIHLLPAAPCLSCTEPVEALFIKR